MINDTLLFAEKNIYTNRYIKSNKQMEFQIQNEFDELPGVLFVSSYPPRECGIATYTNDLIIALDNKFNHTFSLKVCALEDGNNDFVYPDEVKYILDTKNTQSYIDLAYAINNDSSIDFVLIQHEFGFFEKNKLDFLHFLNSINKPISLVFHTVLPNPTTELELYVKKLVSASNAVIVMTKNSASILVRNYDIPMHKIEVIPHGTHLVPHISKNILKEKYQLQGKRVLSTFGLISSGKGIETTLEALPEIIENNPDVIFLIIGKTHPSVVAQEGEIYRDFLIDKVHELNLYNHVKFVNQYLPLHELLEYLQLTDIYVFTSLDPNQAVSGTFSYAMSCGCPIISTPIPHALEFLDEGLGVIVDFKDSKKLASQVAKILSDDALRINYSDNSLQKIVPTSWENSAIAHAKLVSKMRALQNVESVYTKDLTLTYKLPEINLNHLKKMTTDFGIIQFSHINQPDILSGYTLDDNARALIAICMNYSLFQHEEDLIYIEKYLDFIEYCQQSDGSFLNYIDENKNFTEQNNSTNLSDANGRAIWAIGYLISNQKFLPINLVEKARKMIEASLVNLVDIYSTRAMAFSIKGLYYYNLTAKSNEINLLITTFADRLVQMYIHESESDWKWYENYLTYANSVLPESLLLAWLATGNMLYKNIAKASMVFLMDKTFKNKEIKVISNQTWLYKGSTASAHGEQPIDVAYTIMTLFEFYKVFKEPIYLTKMFKAFNWFLGKNHLCQIVYNPCTGGCFDGLEETKVNLNQGAESTVSYLMARLTIENYNNSMQQLKENAIYNFIG